MSDSTLPAFPPIPSATEENGHPATVLVEDSNAPKPAVTDATLKTYQVEMADDTYTVKARSIAWTDSGQFILLMDGETVKHLFVAEHLLSITETEA